MLENLSGKDIYIENSHGGDFLGQVRIGNLVANHGTAQIVYKIRLNSKDCVLKILRPETQKKLSFTGEKKQFSKVDFYGTCIEALRELDIPMPEVSDAIKMIGHKGIPSDLGFVQSFIPGNFVDDSKTVDLPDLGKIYGEEPRGTLRPLNFQETFYTEQNDTILWADRDKYLHQLKQAAEHIGVKTMLDLQRFKQTIISSM